MDFFRTDNDLLKGWVMTYLKLIIPYFLMMIAGAIVSALLPALFSDSSAARFYVSLLSTTLIMFAALVVVGWLCGRYQATYLVKIWPDFPKRYWIGINTVFFALLAWQHVSFTLFIFLGGIMHLVDVDAFLHSYGIFIFLANQIAVLLFAYFQSLAFRNVTKDFWYWMAPWVLIALSFTLPISLSVLLSLSSEQITIKQTTHSSLLPILSAFGFIILLGSLFWLPHRILLHFKENPLHPEPMPETENPTT